MKEGGITVYYICYYVKKFKKNEESGQALVEYALVLGVLLLVATTTAGFMKEALLSFLSGMKFIIALPYP